MPSVIITKMRVAGQLQNPRSKETNEDKKTKDLLDRWARPFLNRRFLQTVYGAPEDNEDSVKTQESLSLRLLVSLIISASASALQRTLNGSLRQEQPAFIPAVNALWGQSPEWTEQKHLWQAGIWKPGNKAVCVSLLILVRETLLVHGWPPGFSGSTSACLPSSHTQTHTDVDAGGRESNKPGTYDRFRGQSALRRRFPSRAWPARQNGLSVVLTV